MVATTPFSSFTPQHAHHFERLNTIWLEENNLFENIDAIVLSDPQTHIIDKGGEIYFIWQDEMIVGTAAIVPLDSGEWELTKLAVDPGYRGQGLGEAIMLHVHEAARKKGLDKLILYSQFSLSPAISLYRKLGYYEVPIDQLKYARCDIKMEIPLSNSFSKERLETWKTRFADGPDQVENVLKGIPKDAYHWKPEGRWSIHQNIIHLADSEANSYIRLRRGLAESGKDVIAYDQNAWVSKLYYEQQSADDALALFRLFRKMSSALMDLIPDEVWTTHTIEHPENGVMTLYDWLKVYAHHNHSGQIGRTYKEWLDSQSLSCVS